MTVRVQDNTGGFGPRLRDIMRQALFTAAREYAGQAPAGGGGGAGAVQNDFRRRFTASNTHGFAPLSDRPHFVVVQRKANGRWVGFMADGYATSKRRKFGQKPILVATGQMVRDIRAGARARKEGDRSVVVFRLSKVAGFHFAGTPTMPRRDPVSPNREDRAAYLARARIIARQLVQRWQAGGKR